MLTGKRVKIRAKKLSDAREDYRWQIDPELVKLDAAEILMLSFEEYYREYTFELCYPSANRHEFGVDTLDGVHIANCVYYNVDKTKSQAEIGIMIGNRDYWGQGYGEEIINLLIDYVFTKHDLNKIYLNTLTWNDRAQNCFRKCGFEEKDLLQHDGYQFFTMTLTREIWQKLRTSETSKETV